LIRFSNVNTLTTNIPASLHEVVSNSPYSVALLDRELCYLTVSQKWKNDFKLVVEPAGKCHAEIFRVEGKEWLLAYHEVLDGKPHQAEESELIFPNGLRKTVRWELQSWKDTSGETGGVLVYMELITDKEEKEAHVKRMLDLYEQSNEVARVGAWEVDLLKNEIYWSPVTKQLHEVSQEYVPNLTAAIAFMKEGANRDKLVRAFVAAVQNGEGYNLELEMITARGKELWVRVQGNAEWVNGNVVRVYGIFQDITKTKKAEQAMAVSEEKYRKIFENTQDIYYRTDQNGIVNEISPSIEKYYGDKRENIIGHPAVDFYYYNEDRDRILRVLKQDGSVIDFEVKLKTKNSELRYASVNARMIIEEGEVIGSEGSIRDITFRKLQENELMSLNTELKALNTHREKLLSIVGHDLRNPVAASLKLAELAMMDVEEATKEELTEYICKMKAGLQNANELLEDLLRWAKNQFNTLDFHPVLIDDLQLQVVTCLKRLKPMADAKRIVLIEKVGEGFKVFADKDMLATIIRNLVSNAIKFTQSGTVVVAVSQRSGDILFSVTDTGKGIPESIVNQIWKKSSHYTSYGTSGEKGTGLGLELCLDFVKKHKGKIWVESKVGEGSSFYFTIPTKKLSN